MLFALRRLRRAPLLARTTPLDQVKKKSDGLSVFLVDLREATGVELEVHPIQTMMNHETNQVFFSGLKVPRGNLIGEEGRGFRYILDGMNAERTLIAAECIGDGYWFIDRASAYAGEREVFGRPIGANQAISHPLARAHMQLQAAMQMMRLAAWRYDNGLECGEHANTAKYLAAEAGWFAADQAVQTHGGLGYATEYHVERYWREARLQRIAPVSQEMTCNYIAQNVLGLPRSY